MYRWLIMCLLVSPAPAWAALTFSEVAWMGSSVSANHEWIELHNAGSAISVEGWTVTDGMNLTIPLSGTIEGNSYAVLERTSDESASGSAFLLYTGALVNTGATLVLKRADGSIADQVSGGENWQSIGGDNVTKETAQYTTTGWVTAAATPGQANRTSGSVTVPDTTPKTPTSPAAATSSGTTKSRDASETVRFILPANSLKLVVEAQRIGYVNQAISFSAEPTGIGKALAASVVYQWNFGDGNRAFGKAPVHHYAFPGTYVVTLYASVGTQEHLSRHEITVLPITLSVTKNAAGDIQINNDSPYEIDISGYKVAGTESFIFPPYSILLPNQTITLPHQVVGLSSSAPTPWLYDSLAQRISTVAAAVLAEAPRDVVANATVITPLLPSAPANQTGVQESAFGFVKSTATTTPLVAEPEVATSPAPSTTTVLTDSSSTSSVPFDRTRWPYFAFITLLLVSLWVVVYQPRG